jgi:uncharacterized protein (TIGR02678 family)
MSGSLHAQLDATVAEERIQALRSLLQRPLLTRSRDPEALTRVRRHAEYLHDWLGRYPGWHLHLDHELARLMKTPAVVDDATHPAREPKQRHPFSRRRYVLLCLALASCERAGRQITLRRLSEDLQGAVSGDAELSAAGITMDAQRHEDRSDLVAIGRFLLEHQVIARVQGDEESFISGSGDCLYTVQRAILARMLSVRQGPSQITALDHHQRLRCLQAEPVTSGEDNRRRTIRNHLVRRLLERPVLYLGDLDAEERAYFLSQRHVLVREVCAATGLVAESRLEGVALVDPAAELTDFQLPQEGTDGHAALLLATWLVEQLRLHPHEPLVAMDSIQAQLADYALRYGSRWRRDASTIDGTSALAREVIRKLSALDLVRIEGMMVRPLPALARYGLMEGSLDEDPAMELTRVPSGQQTLFSETTPEPP